MENFVRFTNASYKAKFPISVGVLKAFLQVLNLAMLQRMRPANMPTASKVIQKAKTIIIQVEAMNTESINL